MSDGTLSFATAIDTSGFDRGMMKMETSAKGAGVQFNQMLGGAVEHSNALEGALKRVGAAVGVAFTAAQALDFVRQVRDVRKEIQSLEISFETLLGSKEKADALFGSIREFAVNTPMQLKDLASSAQMMLSFNIEEDKIMPYLKALGDISMGDTQKFQSLSLAFSQMSSAGKLMGQDLMQMINAGFNPLAQMAEKTGKSISELKDEMSAGKISAEQVQQAFIDATSEGGKFNGMLEKQSHGIAGAMSNLQGAIDDMMNDLGQSTEGIIAGIYTGATEAVKHYQEIGEAIAVLIGIYGAYKTALAAVDAMQRLRMAAQMEELTHITAIINTVGTETAITEKQISSDLRAAVAKGKLTQAQATQIMEAHAVIEQKREELSMNLSNAIAEEKAAKTKLRSALEASVAAKAQHKAEVERLAAMNAYEQSVEGAAVKESIRTAGINANTAAEQVNTARKELATATANRKAAAQAAETAATVSETAATTANTAATGFLTIAKKGLTAASEKLNAVIMANPYAMAAAAAIALGYGIYKLATYETEAEKATKRWSDAANDAMSAADAEERKVRDLFETLKTCKEGTDEYKQVKDTILSQYGQYLNNLSEEIRTLKDIEGAYRAVAAAARDSAKARKIAEFEEKESNTTDSNRTKRYHNFANTFSKEFRDKYAKEIYNWANGLSDIPSDVRKYMTEAQLRIHQGMIKQVKKENDAYEQNLRAALADVGMDKEDYLRLKTGVNPKSNAKAAKNKADYNKKDWEDYKKSKESEYNAMTKAQRATEKGKQLEREILEADKEISAYNISAGNKSAASAAAKSAKSAAQVSVQTAQRTAQIKEKTEALAKAERDSEFEIRQAAIDAMQEGMAKELARNALNYDKLITANIDRRKQMLESVRDIKQLEWENANPNAKDKGMTFNRDSVTDDYLSEQYLKGLRQRQQDALKAGQEANTQSLGDEADRLQAMLRMLEEYNRVAITIKKKSDEESAKNARFALDEYLSQYGTMQEKRDAIDRIYSEKRRKATSTGDAMKIQQEWNDALNRIEFDDFVSHRAALAFGDVESLSHSAITKLIAEMEKYRDKAIKSFDPQNIAKFEESLMRLKKAQVATSGNVLSNFVPDYIKEKKAAQAELNAAEQTSNDLTLQKAYKEQQVADKVQEIINKVKELNGIELTPEQVKDGSTLDGVIAGMVANGADASQIQTLLDSLNTARTELGGMSEASENAATTLDTLREKFKKFEGGDDVMAKITASITAMNQNIQSAKSLVDDLSSTAEALGADTSVGSDWDNVSTMMNAIAGSAQGLQNAFDSLLSGNVIGVVQGITQSFTSMIKGFAAIHDAGKEREIQKLQKQVEQLDKSYHALDDAISKAYSNDASDLIEQQNTMLQQQRALLLQMIAEEESKKDTDRDKIEQWRQQIEEIDQTIADNKDAAIDAIFGDDLKTAIEDFADAYADAWANGESRAKSAKDVVRQMMRQMVIESIKAAIQSSKAMEQIRQQLLTFFADNVLEDWEQNEIYKMAEQLQRELDNQFGWADSLLKDEADREASKKGIATASQDSVDENNARLTTIQGHTYTLVQGMQELNQTSTAILDKVAGIERNTSEANQKLDTLDKNIRNINASVNDMQTRGIKIKN